MAKIKSLKANWILDSRGFPTVSCQIVLEAGDIDISAISSVPSGASTGNYEALELRDGDKEFFGKGVKKAIKNIEENIFIKLQGKNFEEAYEIDDLLLKIDGTENKSRLGANATLAVSLASHRAFAKVYNLELWQYLKKTYFNSLLTSNFPRLMCNIINGGVHANNDLSIQEFMIVPRTGLLESDIHMASEIYHSLKKKLASDGYNTSLGDEGGFAPKLKNCKKALEYLTLGIKEAGHQLKNCDLAIDVAANEFYNPKTNKYLLDKQEYSQTGLTDYYKDLVENFKLLSIEDPFFEDDLIGWELVTKTLGPKVGLVGDDVFVTNLKRFEKLGLENQIANSVLIKPNQIGTILETCALIRLAKQNNYSTIVSHRSGETTSTFISDLAFASQSEFIKLGAPARGERIAKFNRLLEISRSL